MEANEIITTLSKSPELNAKQDAINTLKKYDLANNRVVANVTSVSKSGMSRTIDFYLPIKDTDGDIYLIGLNHEISFLTGYKDNGKGLKVKGCGMDMIFHVLDWVAKELKLESDIKFQTLR